MIRTVQIQISKYVPKTYMTKAGVTKTTVKKYRTWVNIGKWPVIAVARDCVVVRQFDSISLYDQYGYGRMTGYHTHHPKAKEYGLDRAMRWRIHPESMRRLFPRRKFTDHDP